MDMDEDALMASTTSKTTQKYSSAPVQGPAATCGTTTPSVKKTAAEGIRRMETNAFSSSSSSRDSSGSIPLKDHDALMSSTSGTNPEEEQKRAAAGASTSTSTTPSAGTASPRNNITATTNSLLLSSGLSEQIMCQRVLTYLHRTNILQGVMKVQPLRNRFLIDKFYCKEHGTILQAEDLKEERSEDGGKKTGGGNQHSLTVENTSLENDNNNSSNNSNSNGGTLGLGGLDPKMASNYEYKDTDTQKPPNATILLKKLYCEDCKMKEDGFLRCPRCEEFLKEDEFLICDKCNKFSCYSCAEENDDYWPCHSCNECYCGGKDCAGVVMCQLWCEAFVCDNCRNPINCAVCEEVVGCTTECCDDNECIFTCDECNQIFCHGCSYFDWCDLCEAKTCEDCLPPINCAVCDLQMGYADMDDLDECGKCINKYYKKVTCPDCTKIHGCNDCKKNICKKSHDEWEFQSD